MLHEEKLNECHQPEGKAVPLNTFLFSGDSPPHWHDFIEILYCRSGSYFVVAGDDRVTCEAGELVLINAKEAHTTVSLSQNAELQVLHIPVSMLYSYLNNDTYFRYYMAFLSGKVRIVRKCYCMEDEVLVFLNRLLAVYSGNDNAFELQSVAYVLLILSRLIQNGWFSLDELDDFRKNDLKKLEPALTYIKEGYMRELTLQEIANAAFMSKSMICKLFRDTLGMTFKGYLNALRLTEAKRLLVTTETPITLIASESGYPNVTYFNRVFKESFHLSPSEFRREYKKNLR